MRAELLPLVREWPRTDQVFITEQGNRQYFAACEGIGAAAATRSFAALRVAAGELDAVISYGWAGALSCGLKPPGVHVVGEVIDARTGERFATDTPHGGMQNGREAPLRLVTLDHVARKDEKRALADRYKAVMVDMEAATVGRLARAHGMKFLCLRGISDGTQQCAPAHGEHSWNWGATVARLPRAWRGHFRACSYRLRLRSRCSDGGGS
jgi:adenosylhomocysteine nucleosidase